MAILHVTDLKVTGAEHYELEVSFDDGTRRRVHLGPLLKGCFEPLRDPEAFAEVYVAPPGVPTWPTTVRPEGAPEEDAMELDLAPEALNSAPGEELPQAPTSRTSTPMMPPGGLSTISTRCAKMASLRPINLDPAARKGLR